MDGVGIQLPPVMPDTYYDISSHGTGYHPYPPVNNSSWMERDDARAFQPQGSEFESHIRHTGVHHRRSGFQETSTEEDIPNPEWNNEEVKDADSCHGNGIHKQSQVAETLNWLSENYERSEGVCLPRCVLYQHYLDFCKKLKFSPAGAATFGKIIRQRFPKLTTRRLGTRGQSKYHYYGIGIKESSIYYHSVYSGKGLTRFSGIKIKTEGTSRKYSLSSKTGTLLPEFPNADNLILPENIEREKMRTFIMMYRTHCQRILDTVISANFDEVQIFLVHFWQGMPDHLLDVLKCDLVTDVVALCDSILYKVLIDVLIPSSIQELPDTLYSEMRLFIKRLPYWLESAMDNIQEDIRAKKLEVAKSFTHSLKRQSSFVQLAQTSRTVLSNQEILTQMSGDIGDVDFVEICTHAGFMEPSAGAKLGTKLYEFFEEFQSLLTRQSSIESYTEWLDNIIDTCVLKPSEDDMDTFRTKAAEFLLQWGAFGALLMRDLTLQNSSSFGAFHLLHIMLDEYVFLVVETRQEQEVDRGLQERLQRHMETAEEIPTQAKLRNSANKSHSPKGRKRRHADGYDSDANIPSARGDKPTEHDCISATAFSRPHPSRETSTTAEAHDISTEHPSRIPPQGALAISPLKPYQTYGSSSYDRPTYLPQFGIGSHSDYVGSGSVFGAGRFPSYSESYSQPFSSNPFSSSISPVNGSYWSDGRGHHSLTDTYQPYGYNKLSAPYDNWNKGAIFRSNGYQDGLARPAFDTRPYYRSSHDNIQVGAPVAVGAYSGNFMDIAPSGSTYCRQDGGVLYQDDLYPVSVTTPFGKSYLSGPFR